MAFEYLMIYLGIVFRKIQKVCPRQILYIFALLQEHMEEDILNYSATVIFRGTP